MSSQNLVYKTKQMLKAGREIIFIEGNKIVAEVELLLRK